MEIKTRIPVQASLEEKIEETYPGNEGVVWKLWVKGSIYELEAFKYTTGWSESVIAEGVYGEELEELLIERMKARNLDKLIISRAVRIDSMSGYYDEDGNYVKSIKEGNLNGI